MAKLLVVDDDPQIRLMARLQLEKAGYEVVEAEDGGRALALLQNGIEPDAVLLDLMMPNVDGQTVIETLHDNGQLEDLPVIVFSAHATDDALDRMLSLGCRGCLNKPYRYEQLLEVVRTAIGRDTPPARDN